MFITERSDCSMTIKRGVTGGSNTLLITEARNPQDCAMFCLHHFTCKHASYTRVNGKHVCLVYTGYFTETPTDYGITYVKTCKGMPL